MTNKQGWGAVVSRATGILVLLAGILLAAGLCTASPQCTTDSEHLQGPVNTGGIHISSVAICPRDYGDHVSRGIRFTRLLSCQIQAKKSGRRIGWMYREDYARAGYETLPQGIDKTRFMQWQSVLPALALVPISVASVILQHANHALMIATLLLGLSFLYFASRLACIRSNGSARQLLLVSIVYLPMVFALQVLTRI